MTMLYPIKKLNASDIAEAVGGRLIYGNADSLVSSVSCDSRTIDAGTLYIPLRGERFDGHDFICDIASQGASGYLCSDGQIAGGSAFAIMVADTKSALLKLASYYRSLFDIPVVGLTGSVGKTTTKEFIAAVLSKNFNTHATFGNFNNDIGVPYTIFGINDDTEAAVIEMGMSNFGEIEALSLCAKPDIAVITNIGTSHIEFLGSREGILKAKSEILSGLRQNGKLILNADDEYLCKIKPSDDYDIVYIGIENDKSDIRAEDIHSDENGTLFKCGGREYRINLPGIHNVYNALAAIAVGMEYSMSYERIYAGLKSYTPDGIRQNIISHKGYKVINDCYNSSPQSVGAALSVLDTVSAKRRIAILGSIGELGDKSEELHRGIGELIKKSKTDVLITAGADAKFIAELPDIEKYSFDTTEDAGEFASGFVREGDAVLIKASRFMKFEEISNILLR